MATGAQTWSTSAATNNSADGSVNWAEGMAPSAVNNSARAEMASAAMWIGDNSGVLLTSGTTAAYTVTSKQVSSAVVDGYTIAVRLHAANEASATLNVDGIGAKAIQRYAGTNLALNEFAAGSIHRFTYHTSSTAWIAHGQRDFTTAPSSFTVTNGTLLSSNLTVSGTATVTGAATLSSSLTVANATLFSSAATVTGKLTSLSSAEITGATLFSTGVTAAGKVVSTSASAGIGYATGAGGVVTQLTSKATGVTLNAVCGEITMHNAQLNNNTIVSFTLTNSAIAAGDNLILNHVSGGSIGDYFLTAACANGSAVIYVRNIHDTNNPSEAIVIRFTVIKGVTA